MVQTRSISRHTSHKINPALLPVIFLSGSTASGKTELAAYLSEELPVELISVDAAQVYRGMDIGTAKASSDFLQTYPHYLIDIRNPDQSYSAAQFRDDALTLIKSIHQREHLPVLVGGTMFYFASLEHGLSKLPQANAALRKQIDRQIKQFGLTSVYQQLIAEDPALVSIIKPNDSQRIQRICEITRITGEPASKLLTYDSSAKIPYPLIKLGLFMPDRKALHQRIETRFMQMIEQGLVDEVKMLCSQYKLDPALPSMRTVGYRQVLNYIEQKSNEQQMIEQSIAATRQLAKRQLTWMRQQAALVWLDVTNVRYKQSTLELVKEFVGG